jgi:PAS domain S-box-containing protein
MLPLRSFAGEVVGVLLICTATDAGRSIPSGTDLSRHRRRGRLDGHAGHRARRWCRPCAHQLRAAREADERMALAIEGSGTGIWDRNAVTGEMYYSRGWKAILGYEDWELSSHLEDAYQRIHPDDLPYVQETVRQHFASRSDTYQVEHRIRCRDGSYKWISSRGKVVARDAQGNALRMIGTTTDITEVKRLTDKLAKSSRMLDYLTSEIPGMVFQFRVPPGERGHFTYVSEGARETYGLTPSSCWTRRMSSIPSSIRKTCRCTGPRARRPWPAPRTGCWSSGWRRPASACAGCAARPARAGWTMAPRSGMASSATSAKARPSSWNCRSSPSPTT